MASSGTTPPADRPTVIVCIGMAGSGKTTFMSRINSHLHANKEPPYVVNLDPAVLNVPYGSNIDIRDSVDYREVMRQYNLGPNGGILTSLNLFATKVDQVIDVLEKRARPDPEHPEKKPIKHILIDTPGQIEVFVWSASGQILLQALASSFPTVIAYIIDTPRTASTATFMSNMLYACSILYKIKLPMVLVFNKTDVKDASFAKEWMTDFDTFQAALNEDEENAESQGGSSYSSSLMNSMGLVLQEFYEHLNMVGVSSRLGAGINEFFEAVNQKREEFERDYEPELARLRAAKDDEKKQKRERELQKMMKGMSVDGGQTSIVEKEDVEMESGDDSSGDELVGTESNPEGLQSRYAAALGTEDKSMESEASYAKYLHMQQR